MNLFNGCRGSSRVTTEDMGEILEVPLDTMFRDNGCKKAAEYDSGFPALNKKVERGGDIKSKKGRCLVYVSFHKDREMHSYPSSFKWDTGTFNIWLFPNSFT